MEHTTRQAIIFDFDGTLADSSGCIVAAAQAVGHRAGLRDVTSEAVCARIGQPLDQMLGELFGIGGAGLERLMDDYSATYVRMAAQHERLFPEVGEMLRELQSQRVLLAIVTGKSQMGAVRGAKRLGIARYFDEIHGILPGTPGKPHPAVLHRALAALDVKAEQALMIGDTIFDLDMAAAGGVDAVGVEWGVHPSTLLRSRQPLFLAAEMGELRRWLRQRIVSSQQSTEPSSVRRR